MEDQSVIDPQVAYTRKCLQEIRHINSMCRKQKTQLLNSEFLEVLAGMLRLSVWDKGMIPIQILLQDLNLFLNAFSYDQRNANELLNNSNFLFAVRDLISFDTTLTPRNQVFIILEGYVNKIYTLNGGAHKNRKQSIVGVQMFHCSEIKKRNQYYDIEETDMPVVIWPTEQTYKLKAKSSVRVLKLQKSAIENFQNTINHQQKQYTNYFLSKWLHLDMYYVKLFKIQAFTSKQLTKRRLNFHLSTQYLYVVCKGHITIHCGEKEASDLVLNQGSILNLSSLFNDNTNMSKRQEIMVSVETEIYLIKIEKEPLAKIMEDNPWVEDHLKRLSRNLLEFRSKVSQRLKEEQRESVLNQFRMSNFSQSEEKQPQMALSKTAIAKFRKTIGMKRCPNRFRVARNQCRDQNNQSMPQLTNFVSSFYPFARVVESEQKVAMKNQSGRTKKVSINMLPEKDSKNFIALKRRIHDQKVKRMRVKKRAQNEIRGVKFFNQDISDQRILDNALFREHLSLLTLPESKLPNDFAVPSKKQKQNPFGNISSSILQKSIDKIVRLDNQKQVHQHPHKESVKHTLPMSLQWRNQRHSINIKTLTSRYSNMNFQVNQTAVLNMSDRIQSSFTIATQIGSITSRSPLKRIMKKMPSGKLRKVKVQHLLRS